MQMMLLPQTTLGQASSIATTQAGINGSKTSPSPEVAALGNFGLVPATPFTGQADISVPLYNLSYKDLSVPIALMYTTKGNKTDEHPGWTGLGWSLQAGGAIYRKVNGLNDEIPKLYEAERGYLYNCGTVNQKYLNPNYLASYSLGGYQSVDSLLKYQYDASPDEFIFNFNGYSGVFFITRPSPTDSVQIKIRSNGNYKLKADILEVRDNMSYGDLPLGEFSTVLTTNSVKRSIYKIRITDEAGNQYIFGGTDNSIELNNNGNYTDVYSTISSAWYLTEIKSPGGYKINFDYKRVGRTYTQTLQRNVCQYSGNHSISGKFLFLIAKTEENITNYSTWEKFAISSHNPVYLTSIKTPSQVINFSSSKSNELRYNILNEDFIKINGNTVSEGRDSSFWQKLDVIDIVGVKKIKFNYLEQITRRLQLSSVELQTAFDRTIQKFSFAYNSNILPPYNARKADHWGYYNGRTYAYGINYYVSRVPDETFMKAEILEKITYPTGGYLKLEYQPHYYAKIARQFPFDIDESQVSDSIAGGLRVSKMTIAADSLATPVTKEYFYVKNYLGGGTRSSGILSGKPFYGDTGSIVTHTNVGGTMVEGQLWYSHVLDNNYLQLSNTNGNHITYSEVTEKSDGGYTVYKYSNHDNGYQDKLPLVEFKNFDSNWDEQAFTSMETFRGLTLSSQVYNSNKELLKESQIEYNIDTTNSEYRVPNIYRFEDESMGVQIYRSSLCFYFIKPPLVKKVTDVNYAQGTTTQNLTTIQSNKYFVDRGVQDSATLHDNYKVTESVFVTSKQDTLKSVFSYPYTKVLAGLDPGGIYKSMLDSNINAPVITQVESRNGVQLRLTNTVYFKTPEKLYLPQYSQVQQGITDSLDTEVVVNSYDQYGNMLEATKRGGGKIAYLWDCIGHYPTAVAQNAGVGDIRYFSFEENNSPACGNTLNLRTDSTSPSGIKCYEINIATPFTVTHSLGGFNSSISHIVSYWSKNGSYTVDGSVSMITGRTLNGWTYYEHTVQNVLGVNIRGTGLIDEVRAYPVNAQLTTFTYLPNIGISSQCDAKNQYVYYEYDSYGRLHIVRNQDKNIVKMICYNYKGETEICNEHIYYNTVQSDSARNTCNPGAYAKMVVCTVEAGMYGSDKSQQDANDKARAALPAKLEEAKKSSPCLFYNQRMTMTGIKQCSSGFSGTTVTYVVDSMKYFSESMQAANDTAMMDLNANYQTYANANGTCHCLGESKKVIGLTCETGQKIVTASTPVGSNYTCTYHYLWSDGSISGNYTESQTAACPLTNLP
ncbi:hypothetical protein GCM10022209_01840 [Chitinophaga oryziterrae]